jgi:protein-tyrosine phosphatase
MIRTPIPESYWVVPNELLAGEYPRTPHEIPSKKKIESFIASGVKAFIDLTEEDESLEPYAHLLQPYEKDGVTHQRFAIRDQSVPSHQEVTMRALDAIDDHLKRDRMVYVHCWGGIGRTGVIVGCWLSRHGHEGDAALFRLKELWTQCSKSPLRCSPETWEQEQYIRAWKEPR